MSIWRRLAAIFALVFFGIALSACDDRKNTSQTASSSTTNVAAVASSDVFTVLAGSELKDVAPALEMAAQSAGVKLVLSYAGTLDMVERVNGGEQFDAVLPPNGAYPALALNTKPLARDKLFYSRVALGVKTPVLRKLGWDKKAPTWAEIAKAAASGQLRYAMTNPASSNTGMSALFAVASAVAGKTEDLDVKEVNAKVLKDFLSGQKLTAGSSGWLAEAFERDPSTVDALINYEAVILRLNEKLPAADKLELVYPSDGVISADYPLMLLNAEKRAPYDKLVTQFKAAAFQGQPLRQAYLRPSNPEAQANTALPTAPVVELSFPNRLEVIDAVLSAYQSELRRPATSIFVLDVSGSMQGARMAQMQEALKILSGAEASAASQRYAAFQARERVILLTFSDSVSSPTTVQFADKLQPSRSQVLRYADDLRANGGTAIYDALTQAEQLAQQEMRSHPDRFVSIVLLTDGINNSGRDFAAFDKAQRAARAQGSAPVRIFPIIFGEAKSSEMESLAQLTGGRAFDARKTALPLVFKEIRGYQ
ncbi:substrate-binding domain-containing protein [Diaphorobacter sp. HDW4B]|uniref:vWA domain-containing protein n=1 Tax=Diaphorobacter sp. HDW4B TaxID=2714925 RepID=UPI001F0D5595|nr:substrate-binding domain-containing protein [Diaphorobacter sp. HDW4B]